MTRTLFDQPLFAQGRHFIEELHGLDDTFNFLENWPGEKGELKYQTILRACSEAACGRFPLDALRENLRRFLAGAGLLVGIEDVLQFQHLTGNQAVGNDFQEK